MADARELVRIVDLDDIRYFEISARRAENGEDRPSEYHPNLAFTEAHSESELITRFQMTLATSDADLTVDLAMRYRLSEPVELTAPVIAEFVEKVAAMAAYPYLREAMATSATRLGVNVPTLGLLKQGALSVSAVPNLGDDADTDSDGAPETVGQDS